MITEATNKVIFNGDGNTTKFPFFFKILKRSDVVVVLAKDGEETQLTKDYYVDLDEGTVNYPGYAPGEEPAENERPEELKAGEQLIVYRDIPITQESDFRQKWPFDVIENGLDKLTMVAQDLKEKNKKFISLPEGVNGVKVTLPKPEPNMGFYWDKTGTKLVSAKNPNMAAVEAVNAAEQAKASQQVAERCEHQSKLSENIAVAAASVAQEAKGSAIAIANSISETGDLEKQKVMEEGSRQRQGLLDLKTSIENGINVVDAIYATKEEVRNKADKATTLSGYGIADAYTKSQVDGLVSSALRYKGTKATYSELPKSGNKIGDVWNITKADKSHGVKAGGNVAWNGNEWDILAGTVDLSEYLLASSVITNDDIDRIVKGE